mgnify:CR=1 FL=1
MFLARFQMDNRAALRKLIDILLNQSHGTRPCPRRGKPKLLDLPGEFCFITVWDMGEYASHEMHLAPLP